jgi:hypothetical protein
MAARPEIAGLDALAALIEVFFDALSDRAWTVRPWADD